MHIAGRNRKPVAGRSSQNHAACVIDGVEDARHDCLASMDRRRLSESRRERQPAPPDFVEPSAPIPDTTVFGPAVGEAQKKLFRAGLNAERDKRRGRGWRPLGRGNDVGAHADHDGEAPARQGLGLQQDTGKLRLPRQDVVGPLQGKLDRSRTRHGAKRRRQRQPSGKTERRRHGRRNVNGFKNAAGQITPRRDPRPLPSPPAGGLFCRDKPHRPALASACPHHGFRIRRARLIEAFEPIAGGCGSWTERECHLRADPA